MDQVIFCQLTPDKQTNYLSTLHPESQCGQFVSRSPIAVIGRRLFPFPSFPLSTPRFYSVKGKRGEKEEEKGQVCVLASCRLRKVLRQTKILVDVCCTSRNVAKSPYCLVGYLGSSGFTLFHPPSRPKRREKKKTHTHRGSKETDRGFECRVCGRPFS
ncbi:hypothetical protein LY76DRAFT_51308 [Colletotrichum caudatum]|nr:hypothetical protein LY76DRAFT_51308 [Colletotrichum caudatum]